jgi:hypothetical protein
MGFLLDHAADGELPKFRLYYLGFAAPFTTVAAPVASGSHTVTPASMLGVVLGAELSVMDLDSPALSNEITAALAAGGAGSVQNGAHSYKIVVNKSDSTHTLPSGACPPVTVVDNTSDGKVLVTRTGTVPTGDTWDLYRTAAGADPVTGAYKLVNPTPLVATATTYLDNIADGSLGAVAPATSTTTGTNAEIVVVTAVTSSTFTATFATSHAANWMLNAATPFYWTDCDIDIEWNGHRWLAEPITPGPVNNQPSGAVASFKIADGDGVWFAIFVEAAGGELALAAIYEAGFAVTNKTAVPDDVIEIYSGRVDYSTVHSDTEDSIEITLMPPAQMTAIYLPTRLLSGLVRS